MTVSKTITGTAAPKRIVDSKSSDNFSTIVTINGVDVFITESLIKDAIEANSLIYCKTIKGAIINATRELTVVYEERKAGDPYETIDSEGKTVTLTRVSDGNQATSIAFAPLHSSEIDFGMIKMEAELKALGFGERVATPRTERRIVAFADPSAAPESGTKVSKDAEKALA